MEFGRYVLLLRSSYLEAEISVSPLDQVLGHSSGQQTLGECYDPGSSHHASELDRSINQREKNDTLLSQSFTKHMYAKL